MQINLHILHINLSPRLIKRALRLAIGVMVAGILDVQSLSAVQADVGKTFTGENANSFGQSISSVDLLAQSQQPRTALVIGNANYDNAANSLANPINDATDIARALQSLGFEVSLYQDIDHREMEDALYDFRTKLDQGGVGVFYYAGHGVQVEGENYLIPLDARLDHQRDVRYETMPLGTVLNAMENSESNINIVIVDACRDNPFTRQWRSGSRTSSIDRGLAEVQLFSTGTVISFATGPNKVAYDGVGQNSPYTASLLNHIVSEDKDIVDVFRSVRADVMRDTNGQQLPWYQESLTGTFSFNPSVQSSFPLAQSSLPPVPPTLSPVQSTSLSSSPPNNAPESDLNLEIDYQALEETLSNGDFQEADLLTRTLILQAVQRESEEWLRLTDIQNFPCRDLSTIDQLWTTHSDEKFGFSVQQEIHQDLGGTAAFNFGVWRDFGDLVAWRADDDWIRYDLLTFDNSAPPGHLPRWGVSVGGFGQWVLHPEFLRRVEDCKNLGACPLTLPPGCWITLVTDFHAIEIFLEQFCENCRSGSITA